MILTDVCQGGGKREDLEAPTGMSKNVGSDLSGARSHWLIDRSRSGRGREESLGGPTSGLAVIGSRQREFSLERFEPEMPQTSPGGVGELRRGHMGNINLEAVSADMGFKPVRERRSCWGRCEEVSVTPVTV